MVKAGKIGEHMQQLANEMGLEESDFLGRHSIRSLSDSFEGTLMLTINNARKRFRERLLNYWMRSADDEAITSCPAYCPVR